MPTRINMNVLIGRHLFPWTDLVGYFSTGPLSTFTWHLDRIIVIQASLASSLPLAYVSATGFSALYSNPNPAAYRQEMAPSEFTTERKGGHPEQKWNADPPNRSLIITKSIDINLDKLVSFFDPFLFILKPVAVTAMHRRPQQWKWRWQVIRATSAPFWGSLWNSWPTRRLTGSLTYASW